ncbi:MAG TPA: hypothetical protein VIR59_08250 [Gaiellaceae bacterium]|jgi:hypothetical protein
MGAKKQQTFAKLQRERRVKEKRQLKLEKKQAAAARKLAEANGEPMPLDEGDQPDETTAAPPE